MLWLTIFSFSLRHFRGIASNEKNPRSEERRNRLNNTNIIEQYDLLASVRSQPSFAVADAKGAGFIDETGKEYVNLNEINRQLGYGNLHFTKTVKDCLESAAPEKTSQYKNSLYHHIVETTNNDFQKILLTSSGSEAVEWAIRVARKRTGRYDIVSFWNSIHGRTYLAIQCARPDMDLWLQVWFLPPIPIASDARLMKLQNNVTFVVWSFCSERSRRSHRRRLPR
jgi:4-aminobutyrate aminotransferase-like enzyme